MIESDNTSKAWPYWLLRYMMMDDEQSFEDLVWSVGGSPPYGGISYEEAEAVFNLIENFRGGGMASDTHYETVRKFIKKHSDRSQVLDLFYHYDKIVSSPENYTIETADQGLAIAEEIGEAGMIGLFKLFQSGVLAREGKNFEAADLVAGALDLFLEVAEKDPSCTHRVEQAAQNAIAWTALAGDIPRAKKLLEDLSEVLPEKSIGQLNSWIAAQQ
jgi:hypothetical protein